MEQLYVLQLANKKYYVGKTTDVMKRFNEHKSGSGSAWTKLHAPKKILECRPLANDHDENNVTKDYMKKYGIENVRGGAYTQTSLPDHVKTVLNTEIRSNKDTCYKCGEAGHFANQCGQTEEEEEEQVFWGCDYCHERRFTTEYGCMVHERSCKKKQTEIIYESPKKKKSGSCYRCGRSGHYSPDCYARTDTDGNELD